MSSFFRRQLPRSGSWLPEQMQMQMLAAFGSEPFGTEYLRRHDPWTAAAGEHSGGRPFYETYGEQRVSSGHYQQVIRQAEHLEPVQRALRAVGRRRPVAPVQAHSE